MLKEAMSCWCAGQAFTYGAAGVGAAVEERARHPHDLSLHLPHTGKDVRVKRVAPRKISINLGTVGRILHERQIFTRTEGAI